MDILIVIAGIISIVILYYFLGFFIKLIWNWWVICIAFPPCLFIGLNYHYTGAILAVIGFVASITINNKWQDTSIFMDVEKKIDRIFSLEDA